MVDNHIFPYFADGEVTRMIEDRLSGEIKNNGNLCP